MFFEREKALKRNVATRQPARDVRHDFCRATRFFVWKPDETKLAESISFKDFTTFLPEKSGLRQTCWWLKLNSMPWPAHGLGCKQRDCAKQTNQKIQELTKSQKQGKYFATKTAIIAPDTPDQQTLINQNPDSNPKLCYKQPRHLRKALTKDTLGNKLNPKM